MITTKIIEGGAKMVRRYTDFCHYTERHLVECFFREDQRSSQNRHALRKVRLQISRLHSFGGYTALSCIISRADDFGNTL